MARTEQNTVLYFPHDSKASTGDTLTILQSRYGNNGYAVWFKILEKLASSDGHYLDMRNPMKWQLFIAYLGVDEITTVEILKLLVEINAIDKELWASRVIWCQKLVDNVAEVYKNRRRERPQKPIISHGVLITTTDNPITTTDTNPPPKNNDDLNLTTLYPARDSYPPPKSKVKESKVNNIVIEKVNEDEDLDNHFKKFVEIYEDKFKKIINNTDAELLQELSDEFPVKWFEEAVDKALENGANSLKYVSKILYGKVDNKNNGHKQFDKPQEKPQPPIKDVGEDYLKYLEKQKQHGNKNA